VQRVFIGLLPELEILPDVRGRRLAVVVGKELPDQRVGVGIRISGQLHVDPLQQLVPRAAALLGIDAVDAALVHVAQVLGDVEHRRPLRPVRVPVPNGDAV